MAVTVGSDASPAQSNPASVGTPLAPAALGETLNDFRLAEERDLLQVGMKVPLMRRLFNAVR